MLQLETTSIRPRRVRFDWSNTPVEWIAGDLQTAHTFDVLHLLLPSGERWFVHVFQQALPLLRDPEIRTAVRGFIGQEATHSRAHQAVLDHLARHGVDTTEFTDFMEFLFDTVLGDEPFGVTLPPPLARSWLLHRVALVAAIEHYTSFLGAWILDDSGALDSHEVDPTMLDLLRWHGAEEVEHRDVAYEAAVSLGIGRAHRSIAFLETSLGFYYLWYRAARFLVETNPRATEPFAWSKFFEAGRRGRLPTARAFLAQIPRYFRRGYHPSEIGNVPRALAYLARSPALRAAR